MTRTLKLAFLAVSCCIFYPANTFAETQVSPEVPKTQVVIIGTIHSAHHKNPKYSPDVLKEIILSLKPDAILNELPLSLVDSNGRPKHRDYSSSPEGWASYTAAMELGGIPQIPFDRPDRQENFKKTNYFGRQKRANKLSRKWGEEVMKEYPNSVDLKISQLLNHVGKAEYHLFMNCAPEIINSEAHDSIARTKHSVWHDILPDILTKYPGYETLIDDYHFSRDQWRQRNRIMADNIIKTARQYPDKRLIVVTGATHRYILRDLLKDEKGIDLKEYWEIIEPNTAESEKNNQSKSDTK